MTIPDWIRETAAGWLPVLLAIALGARTLFTGA